jgi:hypothetical protein
MTLLNGATWTSNGRLGGAIDLPGGPPGAAGPHVALAKSPLADCTTSATVALWVRLRSADNSARVFDFGNSGTFFYLAATDADGKMHFAMEKDGTPAFDLIGAKPIPPDNAWHHAAVTIDPTGMVAMYLDGVPITGPAQSTNLKPEDYATGTQNWLGRSQSLTAHRYLNGALDDLRISCRAYTPDEIKALASPIPEP